MKQLSEISKEDILSVALMTGYFQCSPEKANVFKNSYGQWVITNGNPISKYDAYCLDIPNLNYKQVDYLRQFYDIPNKFAPSVMEAVSGDVDSITIVEAAEKYAEKQNSCYANDHDGFIAGAEWYASQFQQRSVEDVVSKEAERQAMELYRTPQYKQEHIDRFVASHQWLITALKSPAEGVEESSDEFSKGKSEERHLL